MNKQLLSLAFFLALFATSFSATLRVQEDGDFGAYTTIIDATIASQPGDVIIVFPRAASASYAGFSDTSVVIMCALENQRFSVNSDITLSGPGTALLQAEVLGQVTALPNAEGCRLAGCAIQGRVNFGTGAGAGRVYVDNNFITGSVLMRGGRLSGNFIVGNSTANQVVSVEASVAGVDSTVIAGNSFFISGNPSGAHTFISLGQSAQYVYIVNNFFRLDPSTSTTVLHGSIMRNTAPGYNVIANNSILVSSSTTSCSGFSFQTALTRTNIVGNVLYKPSASGAIASFYTNTNATGPNDFSYNYFQSASAPTSGPFVNLTPNATNVFPATFTMDISTGAVTSGQPIDGGHPGLSFLDLDLTRNDGGCFGGSLSRANFMTAETGARVLFMNAPRSVATGDGIGISGEGVDK